jgi:hypothetical protein
VSRDIQTQATDASWRPIYKLGGAAALVAAILCRRWLAAEVGLLHDAGLVRLGTVPESGDVAGWFALLHSKWLLGLTLLDFFDCINYLLVGLIFVALYGALRRASKGPMTLAMALGFVGIAVYLASNQVLTLLALSHQYAAAATEAQRAMLLAAGQVLLASSSFAQGGAGVSLGFFLVNLAALIVAVVMLGSGIFSRATAYIGIVANAFGLCALVALAFAPSWVFVPLSLSAPFLLVWYILIGVKLFRLGRHATGPEA